MPSLVFLTIVLGGGAICSAYEQPFLGATPSVPSPNLFWGDPPVPDSMFILHKPVSPPLTPIIADQTRNRCPTQIRHNKSLSPNNVETETVSGADSPCLEVGHELASWSWRPFTTWTQLSEQQKEQHRCTGGTHSLPSLFLSLLRLLYMPVFIINSPCVLLI